MLHVSSLMCFSNMSKLEPICSNMLQMLQATKVWSECFRILSQPLWCIAGCSAKKSHSVWSSKWHLWNLILQSRCPSLNSCYLTKQENPGFFCHLWNQLRKVKDLPDRKLSRWVLLRVQNQTGPRISSELFQATGVRSVTTVRDVKRRCNNEAFGGFPALSSIKITWSHIYLSLSLFKPWRTDCRVSIPWASSWAPHLAFRMVLGLKSPAPILPPVVQRPDTRRGRF